jgi:hypothetical protein
MIYTYINSKQQDQPKIDKTNATESINFNAPLFTICFAAGQQSKKCDSPNQTSAQGSGWISQC